MDNNDVQVVPNLAILNTEIEAFEWYDPQPSANVGTYPSLAYHTANLLGNYMIVAFGKYFYFIFTWNKVS